MRAGRRLAGRQGATRHSPRVATGDDLGGHATPGEATSAVTVNTRIMRTRFREEDVGKEVVRPNGGTVGVVVAVEDDGERARVETDEGLAESVAAALGRGDDDVVDIPMDEVETVTDETVRLQRPLE